MSIAHLLSEKWINLSTWFRMPSSVCECVCVFVCDWVWVWVWVCVWMLARYSCIYFIAMDCLSKIPLDILTTCDKIWTTINSSGNCSCSCCCWLIAMCALHTHSHVCSLSVMSSSPNHTHSLSLSLLLILLVCPFPNAPTWNMNFIYSLDRYIEVITQAWNKLSPDYVIGLTLAINVRVYLLLRADISHTYGMHVCVCVCVCYVQT